MADGGALRRRRHRQRPHGAQEKASALDGATACQKFRYIVLPMMRPGLLTVAIIVGLTPRNEFVIAVTLLQNESNVAAILKSYDLRGTALLVRLV